jgi:competence protein ComEA
MRSPERAATEGDRRVPALAAPGASPDGRLAAVRRTVSSSYTRLRASPWIAIAGRAFALTAALLLFAWIGRTMIGPPTARASPPAASLTRDAATDEPARTTSDGPDAGERASPKSPEGATGSTGERPSASSGERPSASTRRRATPEDPVFLNDADADDLRRLPGVGPKRAEAIVAQRRRVGRFQRVEDLLRIKGIGRKTLRKWLPLVRLESRPRDAAGPAAGA